MMIKEITTFEISTAQKIYGRITINCISPEARELIDKIMEEWEPFKNDLRESQGYEPSHYQLVYWLIRWSGLIQLNENL